MTDFYYDPDLPTNGDGSTPAAGFNTLLSVFATMLPGDVLWCRRSDTSYVITANWQTVSGINIVGWPKVGEPYYDERPSAGTSAGWDADVAEYAIIESNSQTTFVYVDSDSEFVNFQVYSNYSWSSGANYNSTIQFLNDSGIIRNANHHYDGNNRSPAFAFRHSGCRVYDFDGKGSFATSSTGDSVLSVINGSDYCECIDVDLELTDIGGISSSRLFYCYGNYCKFKNINLIGENSDFTDANIGVFAGEGNFIDGFNVEIGAIGAASPIERDMEIIGNNYVIRNARVVATQPNDKIRVNVSGDNVYAHFTELNAVYQLLLTGTGSVLEVEDITVEDGVVMNIGLDTVLVTKNAAPTTPAPSIVQGAVWYSSNHGGVEGYLKCHFGNGYGESSSVNRTGGNANSIKVETEFAHTIQRPFHFGVRDKAEFLWVEVTTGSTLLTLYGAYKTSYYGPSYFIGKKAVVLECTYKDSNGLYHTINSEIVGDLESDSSVWNGDTDLVPFKVELPITIDTDQTIPVRVAVFTPVIAGAYLYFDPLVVVS